MALRTGAILLLVLHLYVVAGDHIVPSGATFSHSNHDPKYNIEIHSADAPYHPEPGQESIIMTDRDGQKCECFLPNHNENKGNKEDHQSGGSITLLTGKEGKIKTPDELVETLKDQCLTRLEGWWSYEFCYKGKVRQVHLKDQKVVQEFILGVYDEKATEAIHQNSPDVSVQKDPRSKTAAQRYHAHVYKNGTICDLTNEPRETEVRFVCSQSNRALIQSVKEVSTCKYQLMVQCPALCRHPLFQEEKPTWYTINCNVISSRKVKDENIEKDRQLAIGGVIPVEDGSEGAKEQ